MYTEMHRYHFIGLDNTAKCDDNVSKNNVWTLYARGYICANSPLFVLKDGWTLYYGRSTPKIDLHCFVEWLID